MPPPNGCKNYFTLPCTEELILIARILNLRATHTDFCLGCLLSCSQYSQKCPDHQAPEQSRVAQKKRAPGMLWVLVGPHEVRASYQLQVAYKACKSRTFNRQQESFCLQHAHISSAKKRRILAVPVACDYRNSASGKKVPADFLAVHDDMVCVYTASSLTRTNTTPLPLSRGHLSETHCKI